LKPEPPDYEARGHKNAFPRTPRILRPLGRKRVNMDLEWRYILLEKKKTILVAVYPTQWMPSFENAQHACASEELMELRSS
jgi:hypothetical protein